jgi:hypothetical protein
MITKGGRHAAIKRRHQFEAWTASCAHIEKITIESKAKNSLSGGLRASR